VEKTMTPGISVGGTRYSRPIHNGGVDGAPNAESLASLAASPAAALRIAKPQATSQAARQTVGTWWSAVRA